MISGLLYRDMVISAANAIDNKKEEVNSLNVFPVPDGDTGINMSLTMQAGKKAILGFEGTLSECSEKVAGALLRGGRGNSGVILSLFFRGMSKEFKGKTSADVLTVARAFRGGVEAAYKAVKHPTEGTVLTVMRLASDRALELAQTEIEMPALFEKLYETAQQALANTPELLPVLKQANVVDAGGKGFTVILEGMLSVLRGNGIVEAVAADTTEENSAFSHFDTEDIQFAYCTECIIDKLTDGSVTDQKVEEFRDYIMNAGDSGVFIDDPEFIKFHVHTNDPGKVLSECLRYGTLAKVKIENMKAQHTSLVSGAAAPKTEKVDEKRAPEKKYGFVSVCAGDGIEEVFRDLGVDSIVKGGQTMNPSTDDIVHAVNQTPSEIVFVFPNNKNIYMAAKQAVELVSDKKVVVLKSVSVPQGISALLTFDPDANEADNVAAMKAAMKNVRTEKMTFAARDSVFENAQIKEGQILGLVENSVKYIKDSKEDCLRALCSDIKDYSCITLFYGEDIDEQEAQSAAEIMKEELGEDKEIMVINGGQPVYYYMISAE